MSRLNRGDKLAYINTKMYSFLVEVDRVIDDKLFFCTNGVVHDISMFRHATAAEIKARHRLDDNITDSVADIKYHVNPNTVVIE